MMCKKSIEMVECYVQCKTNYLYGSLDRDYRLNMFGMYFCKTGHGQWTDLDEKEIAFPNPTCSIPR